MSCNATTTCRVIAIIAITILIGSCDWPSAPPATADDAGDYSFVRQVVPILHGRKIKGYDEVKLLADFIPTIGRTGVVRVLMEQPEYLDHWADYFVDRMRVHRDTDKKLTSCYSQPLRSVPDGGGLARRVRNRAAGSGEIVGEPPFNMLDLIYSSLAADDLSPILRGHLFAMMSKPRGGNELHEVNVRDDFGVTFATVYTNRQIGCLGCHNAESSTTGTGSDWNRTLPVPGLFEAAIFEFSYGRSKDDVNAFFRSAVNPSLVTTSSAGPQDLRDLSAPIVAPWGISGCGSFKVKDPDLDDPAYPDDPLNHNAYFVDAHGLQGTIWELEEELYDSINFLHQHGLNRYTTFSQIVNDDSAFGAIVSMHIIDGIWKEVMGYPLTIPITFPRNEGQRDILWNLNESTFLSMRWSLKQTLRRMVRAEYFNRKAPSTGAGSSPYQLPMFFDPWVASDPRFPPEALPGWMAGTGTANDPVPDSNHSPADDPERHFNSMTESIHRYSPRSLLNSVHVALGWNAPRRFPNNSYPSRELAKAIGQYYTDAEPGFSSVDFQGLLFWEHEVGRCAKEGAGVSNKGVSDDWIDNLIAEVPGYDVTHSIPANLEDLTRTMKDWLLGTATLINPAPQGEPWGEAATLRDYFGMSLGTPAASLPPDELENKLRGLCGVYLESPQFMLAGVAPTELGPKPRLRVCNDGPCTYRELCEAIKPAVEAQRWIVTCHDDTVDVVRQPRPPPRLRLDDELCPRGRCILISMDPRLCLANPESCPRNPPICDIRCGEIECCGGPLPPLDEDGIYVGWAEGGRIHRAAGIRILPQDKPEFSALETGAILNAGDLLEIRSGGHLSIAMEDGGTFSTPKEGAPEPEEMSSWLFLVTGQSILDQKDKIPPVGHLSPEKLAEWLKRPDIRFGAAGPVIEGADQPYDLETLMRQRRPPDISNEEQTGKQ